MVRTEFLELFLDKRMKKQLIEYELFCFVLPTGCEEHIGRGGIPGRTPQKSTQTALQVF